MGGSVKGIETEEESVNGPAPAINGPCDPARGSGVPFTQRRRGGGLRGKSRPNPAAGELTNRRFAVILVE